MIDFDNIDEEDFKPEWEFIRVHNSYYIKTTEFQTTNHILLHGKYVYTGKYKKVTKEEYDKIISDVIIIYIDLSDVAMDYKELVYSKLPSHIKNNIKEYE